MHIKFKFFVVILILQLQIPAGIFSQPIANSRTTSIDVAPQISLPAIDDQNKIAESFSTLPLTFEPNYGQADDSVQFIARGKGYDLLVKAEEAILAFAAQDNSQLSSAAGVTAFMSSQQSNQLFVFYNQRQVPNGPVKIVRILAGSGNS